MYYNVQHRFFFPIVQFISLGFTADSTVSVLRIFSVLFYSSSSK
jgi:hypothetical protein